MRSTATLCLAFAAAIIALAQARAEVWPQRNVRIVTPFPVGTGGDVSIRLFAEKLSERWGKPVIIENRPGADGILAVMALVGAHDAHTLLYTNGGPVTANAFDHENLPYVPTRDLIPISSGAEVAVAVSVPASLKIAT